MTRRTFGLSLGMTAMASVMLRLGYVGWQASHDPTFARPILDGAFYLAWARGLASGAGDPAGAFYLAPLYPHLLAGFLRLFGDALGLLYALQQTMLVAAGCLLALRFAGSLGEPAALFAALALFLYHPAAFFASRPIGEPVALFLAALGVYLLGRRSLAAVALSGIAFGLATLARPNLLLVVAGLTVAAISVREWQRALVLAAAVGVTLAPVTIRNRVDSGHRVLVSSNGGLTLFHGNGPGALGIFTPATGFSGSVAKQQEEATLLARTRTGKELDAVDADRYWGREAVRTRLNDPLGTLELAGRRVLLVLDNYEHSLDDAPALDDNPWRLASPLPFSLLLGLASVGLIALGFAGSGGSAAWVPILASAATPLVFYVSSRYRLPMALFLCVPAGAGAAAILGGARVATSRRRLKSAILIGVLVAGSSLLVPSASLARAEEAAALANRASVLAEAHDLGGAEREARRALVLDPSSVPARYNLAVVLAAGGRSSEAQALYREVIAADPTHAESAGNLAKLLIEQGAAKDAVPILERALAARPGDAACWTNLVVAWIALGDVARAQRAVAEAENMGVQLAPELVEATGAGAIRVRPIGETGR
jgi:tetratricopeptide (TPR) repeat protein